MEQLIAGLLLWISQNTSFQYQPEMPVPEVAQITQERLVEKYLGEDEKPLSYLSESDREVVFNNLINSLEAIYDSDNNIIYLGERLTPDSSYGRAVLVHELVHFLQHQYDKHEEAACLNHLEKDAYLIQAEYMKENDLTPAFNSFTIAMRSLCDHEMY